MQGCRDEESRNDPYSADVAFEHGPAFREAIQDSKKIIIVPSNRERAATKSGRYNDSDDAKIIITSPNKTRVVNDVMAKAPISTPNIYSPQKGFLISPRRGNAGKKSLCVGNSSQLAWPVHYSPRKKAPSQRPSHETKDFEKNQGQGTRKGQLKTETISLNDYFRGQSTSHAMGRKPPRSDKKKETKKKVRFDMNANSEYRTSCRGLTKEEICNSWWTVHELRAIVQNVSNAVHAHRQNPLRAVEHLYKICGGVDENGDDVRSLLKKEPGRFVPFVTDDSSRGLEALIYPMINHRRRKCVKLALDVQFKLMKKSTCVPVERRAHYLAKHYERSSRYARDWALALADCDAAVVACQNERVIPPDNGEEKSSFLWVDF